MFNVPASAPQDDRLYLGSDLQVGSFTPNTSGIVSGAVQWTAKQGTIIVVPQDFNPVCRLLKSDGTDITRSTKVLVSILLPGVDNPQPLGSFSYAKFYGKSANDQQSLLYQRGTLASLQRGADVLGGWSVYVQFKGTDVIDPTQADTALEIPVKIVLPA